MSRKLVAYFSASGTTAAAAKKLAEAAGADLYEIRPQTPYTRADLDWMNKKSRSSGIGSSAANLHALASAAAWLDGQRFSGSASRSAVESWVNGLGLTLTPAAEI